MREFTAADILVKKQSAMYPGADRIRNRTILMNNRMGLRIEFDIDIGALELWVNPKAGRSLSYKDVNFSCRDDFTTVFDKISFPDLDPTQFQCCDYDPFQSILHFENQTIFFLSLIDKPIVIMRFERDEVVDFKSDKADTPIRQDSNNFTVSHPDRGYEFEFNATITDDSSFRHSLVFDQGRSTYARATIKAGSMLILSAGLTEDKFAEVVDSIKSKTYKELYEENLAKVEEAASCGIIKLDKDKRLENLLELNKRVLISMQNESGAIQAAIKRIYYLIWVRDGGMIWSLCSYAGWTWGLEKWTEFLLANPTMTNERGMTGKMFGQMVNGKISKWQEDGPFYAVWSAFTHWTQTASDKFISNIHLNTLEAAVDWLERYCFDSELGLFGRYFYCETALTGARDFAWDNAVGKPTQQMPTVFEGRVTTRSYDIYVNAYMHSVYMMLSAMQSEVDPKQSKINLEKAQSLETAMAWMFEREGLPSYGYGKSDKGELFKCPPYGMDSTDYQWAMALALFLQDPLTMKKHREIILDDMTTAKRGHFVAGYASVLSGMDTEFVDEEKIMAAINYAAEQSYRPGDYLCMPNTIIEYLDIEDGDIFHDVRPQGFSISAMLAAVANLGVRKLPFGLAVRATRHLSGIKGYEYLGGKIDFEFVGHGEIDRIIINGISLEGSWVIPTQLIEKGQNRIVIGMNNEAETRNTLIYSTTRIESVHLGEYHMKAYGKNQLLFKNLNCGIVVKSADGEVPINIVKEGDYTLITFEGTGEFIVMLMPAFELGIEN